MDPIIMLTISNLLPTYRNQHTLRSSTFSRAKVQIDTADWQCANQICASAVLIERFVDGALYIGRIGSDVYIEPSLFILESERHFPMSMWVRKWQYPRRQCVPSYHISEIANTILTYANRFTTNWPEVVFCVIAKCADV